MVTKRLGDGVSVDEREVLEWLLRGDAAVQFQTHRDLLGTDRPQLQQRIPDEGDAAAILAAHEDPGWGRGFYQPKWTCRHYALLELRDLAVPRDQPVCVREVTLALQQYLAPDGGFNPTDSVKQSDACMNGMFLAFGCYFCPDAPGLHSVVDFLLAQRMADGGFNCRANRAGARVSSVHTTTSVIEGFSEYLRSGSRHRADEVRDAVATATAALLDRRLYQRRGSTEAIRAEFTRLHHPARWHFDVLRGLDVLRAAGTGYDVRLDAAVDVIRARRRADGRWSGTTQYPGCTHLTYPRAGEPDRWLTLQALRVLAWAAS